jgi:uncharacterized membrane protein
MNGLFAPLAAYAANEVRGRVRRQVNVLIGYGVAAAGALGLLVVALVSLHRFLGLQWGPFWADLALGGLFVAVLAGGVIYASRQSGEPAQEKGDAQRAAMSTAAVSAAPMALSMMRRGGGVGVLGALAAVAVGVLAGRAASQNK